MDEIRVHAKEVYLPDILLVNSADAQNVLRQSTHSDIMILFQSGLILWLKPTMLRTMCLVDLTNWPFDRHTCDYRFMSWVYTMSGLDLKIDCKLGVETILLKY